MWFHAPPKPPITLDLQRTQTAWHWLPGGACIVVLEGMVCLHQRKYLAECWVTVPVLLRAGEHVRVDTAGWVEMEPRGPARLRLLTSGAQTWPWVTRGLRAWWAQRWA